MIFLQVNAFSKSNPSLKYIEILNYARCKITGKYKLLHQYRDINAVFVIDNNPGKITKPEANDNLLYL